MPRRSDTLDGTRSCEFGAPEGTPPLRQTVIELEHHNWFVHRDLAKDSSELEVIKDNGRHRIDDIDLTIRAVTNGWYRSVANDFDSIAGETATVREFQRGDWHVTVRTRTYLTSTPTCFILQAELDAWEGNARVFSENWNRTVPRHLV